MVYCMVRWTRVAQQSAFLVSIGSMADIEQIQHFVPGDRGLDEGWLSRLRWPIPAGVTRAYVEAYTDPGERVVVPYCQGPAVVREVLASERQVLALNFDPLLVLAVEVVLAPPPQRELSSAVVRLGDGLKQGVPLRRYLEQLYATTCPACLRAAVADYFVWDREQGVPVAKHLRCPACTWNGQTAADAEDRERLGEVPPRGMHYHYLLDRVASSQGGSFRSRLEYLLELYSPRNLYALAEITLKIESVYSDGSLGRALKVLLLDCLDRCSSLAPLPSSKAHQRGLARPGRFLERNVWYAFEEAVGRLYAMAGKPLPGPVGPREASGSPGLELATMLSEGLVRDLPRHQPPRSLSLILTSPPSLDSTAWSLSYFWGAWLLGSEAVSSLQPLLRQRTPDPAWYARVMSGSLRTLAGLLRDDGRLVLVLSGQRPAVIEALMLAAGNARLGVNSLVQCDADYRLELVPALPQLAPVDPASLESQVQRVAARAAAETIQARGEPVNWSVLHVAALRRLAEVGLFARISETDAKGPNVLDLIAEQMRIGLDDPALKPLGDEYWWLANPFDVAQPLCDRVEEAAYQVLHDALALTEADFAEAVFRRYPGVLTPDATLVSTCLRAYGREPTPGYWQLRSEDLPDARRTERQAMIEHLLALGQKLGYRAIPWDPFDVAWFRTEQPRAVFVVRWQAAVLEALALGNQARGAGPYLVIPGGRAALVSYKLAHNPLWQQSVDQLGWRFIKYRHVRELVAQEEINEYTLRTIVGLDPIVEREGAQIPLF